MTKTKMIWLKREDRKNKQKLSQTEERYIIEKSKHNRNRIILLLTITIYSFLAVLGTSDIDILLLNPIQMPFMKITLPLKAFYFVIPIFIFALHFNTIYMFNQDAKYIDKAPEKLPLSIFDKWQKNIIFKSVIFIFIYMAPLITLIAFFVKFSHYQSWEWSAYHSLLIMLDIVLVGWYTKYFTYSLGVAILSSIFIYLLNMYNILENTNTDFYRVSIFPKLAITNKNLNEKLNLPLLKEYAKEKNEKNIFSLATPVDARDRNFLYADFSNSNMYKFDFSGSNISHAKFNNTQMPYSVFKNVTAIKSDFSSANLSHAFIEEMDAQYSDFAYANLTQSKVYESNFTFSMMQDVDFSESTVNGVDFHNSQLYGSKFISCVLYSSDFTNSEVSFADFSASDFGLGINNFKHACLAKTNFTGISGRLDIRAADLYQTDFTGAILALRKGIGIEYRKSFFSHSVKIPDIQQRIGYETNLKDIFRQDENLTISEYKKLVQQKKTPCGGLFGEDNSAYYAKSIGKNAYSWAKYNKKNIITGTLTKEKVQEILNHIQQGNNKGKRK